MFIEKTKEFDEDNYTTE